MKVHPAPTPCLRPFPVTTLSPGRIQCHAVAAVILFLPQAEASAWGPARVLSPGRDCAVPPGLPTGGPSAAQTPHRLRYPALARGCPVTGGAVGALAGHGWGDLSG